MYDDIILPNLSTSSTIATESNPAYATNAILQQDVSPNIPTDTNVAYSVLPIQSRRMDM